VFSANSQAKKTCRKEKKGRRGGETNANRAGTGDAGAAITARTSNALKAFCYQRCTCRSKKKQENERSRSEEETWIHHRTDTDYIIKQTPPLCSLDAYANLFERQFFSLCFLPFAHRTWKTKLVKKIGVQTNYVFCLLHTGHGVANVLQL
jgi:hypothetical protein